MRWGEKGKAKREKRKERKGWVRIACPEVSRK
jgi:hypothetical protein